MPRIDADIVELQRRAYGPGGNDLSTVERARLAQFEASKRIPNAQSETPESLAHAPTISGSEHAGYEAPSSGATLGHSGVSARGHASGRIKPGTPQTGGLSAASELARIRHGSVDRDQNSEAVAQQGNKWFTPALIVTIGVGAVIVMILAGVIGWGGGYVAGFARHAGPGSGADLVTELHPTEMPERYTEAASGFAGDTDSAGILDGRTYFGSLGDGIDIFTVRLANAEDGDHGLPSDAVCLNVTQTVESSTNYLTFAGDTSCGLPQLDVNVDLFVGAADEEYPTGLHLRTDA